MAVSLVLRAEDKSTYVVSVSFYDAAEDAVVPSSVKWTMTNGAGDVVNSRSAVVATPAATIDILLGAEDTDYADGEARMIVVDAVYSSTEGSDLPLRGAVSFRIEDLRG